MCRNEAVVVLGAGDFNWGSREEPWQPRGVRAVHASLCISRPAQLAQLAQPGKQALLQPSALHL